VSEFALRSEAFTHGGEIPRRHTSEGELERALSGHVRATAELMGGCER
jgi:hypothetical protein